MARILDRKDLFSLTRGASFFDGGAARPRAMQQKTTSLHPSPTISLLSLDELDDDDVIITGFEMGPSNAPEINKSLIVPRMLKTWKKLTHLEPRGFYISHLGQESAMIDTCMVSSLPLIDMDLCDLRYMPFPDMCGLHLIGKSRNLWPLVVSTGHQEVISLDHALSNTHAEDILLGLSQLSSEESLFVIGSPLRVGDVKNTPLNNKAVTRLLHHGGSRDLSMLLADLAPQSFLTAEVIKIHPLTLPGSFARIITLQAASGLFRLLIINSAFYLMDEKKNPIGQVPDRILLLAKNNMFGYISASELRVGDRLDIAIKAAEGHWSSPLAREMCESERAWNMIQQARLTVDW